MKKKLKLNDLKIQSFVTAMDKSEKATLAGGDNTANPVCVSAVPACQMSIPAVCPTCGVQPQGPQSTCPIQFTVDAECF